MNQKKLWVVDALSYMKILRSTSILVCKNSFRYVFESILVSTFQTYFIDVFLDAKNTHFRDAKNAKKLWVVDALPKKALGCRRVFPGRDFSVWALFWVQISVCSAMYICSAMYSYRLNGLNPSPKPIWNSCAAPRISLLYIRQIWLVIRGQNK